MEAGPVRRAHAPERAFAVSLFSSELGDVLISIADTSSTVHNFTDHVSLYEKK
jgi:hypothetical protein